ncbi:MAG: GAF domain-containing protein [Myxococcota bacterium]
MLLRVGQLSRQIEQAKTYEEALELTTTGVQSLFGYDDVALYRASADGTYSITAESTTSAPSRAKPSSSWRCMWEPELFVTKEMPWRCIAGRSQPTIPIIYTDRLEIQPDLSHVLLLAANEEQSVYLQNVQAESVTAMALIHEGIVWGILNAHRRTSRFPPFEERALVQQIGDALLRRHADEEQNLSAAIKRQLKNIQNPTADNIQSTGSSPQMLSRVIPRIHTLIEADGFAIQYADRLFTMGRVPSDSFIFELHKWIDQSPSAFEQFVCTKLSDLYPKARAHSDLACAVLTKKKRSCTTVSPSEGGAGFRSKPRRVAR